MKLQINKPFLIDPYLGLTVKYCDLLNDLKTGESSLAGFRDYQFIRNLFYRALNNIDIDFRSLIHSKLEKTTLAPKADYNDFATKFLESKSKFTLLSSGTTSSPKTVIHDVQSLTRGVQVSENHKDDVWGLAYPLNHLSGLQVLFQAILNGNTIIQLFGYTGRTIQSSLREHSITHLSCTPTFLNLLDTNHTPHQSVRRLTTGGERANNNTHDSISKLFPNAKHRNIYALTEVGNLLISDGVIFTVPERLNELICIIGNTLAIHRSLLANFSTEKHAKPEDWYMTGDLVEIVETKPLRFQFQARRDDIINVGGHKVIPQTVEKFLGEIDGVKQALVYGKTNSVTGEIVVCDIVAHPESTLETNLIRQQLATHLPRHAIPRIVNLVDSLKTTTNGKLCRPKRQ